MELEARMPKQPAMHQGRLVDAGVVEHEIHLELVGHLASDALEEGLELDRTVSAMGLANHLAAGHVEGGEQRRRAVPAIVMGLPLRKARCQGQDRLGAVEDLDLTFLVHAQDERLVRRIQIQPDDVAHFFDELRIRGELEVLHAMRLQTERLPDATDRGVTHAALSGQGTGAPVGGVGGHGLQGPGQDDLHLFIADLPWCARSR